MSAAFQIILRVVIRGRPDSHSVTAIWVTFTPTRRVGCRRRPVPVLEPGRRAFTLTCSDPVEVKMKGLHKQARDDPLPVLGHSCRGNMRFEVHGSAPQVRSARHKAHCPSFVHCCH